MSLQSQLEAQSDALFAKELEKALLDFDAALGRIAGVPQIVHSYNHHNGAHGKHAALRPIVERLQTIRYPGHIDMGPQREAMNAALTALRDLRREHHIKSFIEKVDEAQQFLGGA